jgi:starvation-inducible DNA-binding protein
MTTASSVSNRPNGVVSGLNALLADNLALYVKTKNFHWHLSDPHFRDYHLLFDDQASQIFASTDVMAERVRKLGGQTLKSIGQIARLQRIDDNEGDDISARDMFAELLRDNQSLISEMKVLHALCDEIGDVATASLLENWIDEADGRAWFLSEAGQLR